MTEIFISDSGLDHTLSDMREWLNAGLKSHSSRYKREMMNKTLGAIDALYNILMIIEQENCKE